MSVPVRLTDLRAQAERNFDLQNTTAVRADVLLALVDAVEAAHAYRDAETREADSITAHYAARDRDDGEAEERALDAAKDAMRALEAAEDALDAALARFDLGGADGQPTTTKGSAQ